MSVVIETTLGDITVDLFLQQRPVTCLNFLKLCKMKYYNFNLFHSIRSGFIAQTGDPTGEGTNGESIFGVLEGPEKRFFSGEKLPKIRHTNTGTLSMVCTGEMMVGSQFFFTLAPDLDSLDSIHCVIGEVTEGYDILRKLNDVICDESHRPFRDVRITHTVVLEDPFNDPPGFHAPSRSPSPSAERLKGGRIAPDEDIDETQGKSAAEIQEIIEEKEAKARATILEIVGDLPDADIAPPENVLFVCKLNPVTTDEDLEIIFSRFGKIVSCEVIRDKKTGDSLQYAFVEFSDKKSCEDAYFKMDNVLIDDRRIHVDFSQSVSKMRYLGKGRGVQYFNEDGEGKPSKNDHIRYSKGEFKNGRLPKQYENNDGDRRKDKERSHKDERRRSRSRHRKSPRRSRTRSRRRRSNSRSKRAKSRDHYKTEDRREKRQSERSRDKTSKGHRLRSSSRSRSNSKSRYERSHYEKNSRNHKDRSRSERKQDSKSRDKRQEKLPEDKKNKTLKKSRSKSPVKKLSDLKKHGKEKNSRNDIPEPKPLPGRGKEIGRESRSSSPKESKEHIKDRQGSPQYQRSTTIRSSNDMTEKSPSQGREIKKYQLSKWEREDTPSYSDTAQDDKDNDPKRSRSHSRSGIEESGELRTNRTETILPGQEIPVGLLSQSHNERSEQRSRQDNDKTIPRLKIPHDHSPQGNKDINLRRSRSNNRSCIERSIEQTNMKRENEMIIRPVKPQDFSGLHRDKNSRRSRSNSRTSSERCVEQIRKGNEIVPSQETQLHHVSENHKHKGSIKAKTQELETQHVYGRGTTRVRSRSNSHSSIEKTQDLKRDSINYNNSQLQNESSKKKSNNSRSDVERSPELRERKDKPHNEHDRVSRKYVDPHTHNSHSRTEHSEKTIPRDDVLHQANTTCQEQRKEKKHCKPSVERSSNELSPLQRSRSHQKEYQSKRVSEKISEKYDNDDNNTSSKEKILSKHKHNKKDTNIKKNAAKIKNNKGKAKLKETGKKRKKVMKRKRRDSSSSSTDSSESSSSSSSSSSDEDRKKKSVKRRKKKLSTSSSSSESSTSSSSTSTSSSSSSSTSDSEPHRKKHKKVVSSKASKKGKKK